MSEVAQLHVDDEFRSLIPPLTADERAGLERSILAEGVRDAIVAWNNTIVDGHNRYDIATGQNADGEVLPCSVVQREFADRRAAKVWIIENQLEYRRNLSDADKIDLAETKRELLGARRGRPPKGQENSQNSDELSGANERRTDAKIGKAAGVSRDTVRKYREVKRFGDVRLVNGLRAKDFSMDNAYHLALVGARFPDTYGALWELEGEDAKARYSTPQLKHLLKMPDDATALDLVELVEGGNAKSVVEAHEIRKQEREREARRKRNEEAERRREERKAELEASGFYIPDLRNADFRSIAVAEKIDAIITDPPYPREFLHLYDGLGEFAAKHLKDGGVLVCMSGQAWLPEVYAQLSEHLHYHWTSCYYMPGSTGGVVDRRVSANAWKPLLIYTNGPSDVSVGCDVIKSIAPDKNHHQWGQSESGFAAILERFTAPGDLVCDPFLGGGTTGVLAYQMKRRFLGVEIDPDTYEKAAERLAA